VWLIDLRRGGSTRFTFDASAERDPVWSPDGTQIIFESDRGGSSNLYIKPSNGTGADQLLLELRSASNLLPYSWSVDGQFLLYSENNPKTQRDLWMIPIHDGAKPIAGCETCRDDAEIPFDNILDRVTGCNPRVTDENAGASVMRDDFHAAPASH
jgi:Tol biopolymer transport system component